MAIDLKEFDEAVSRAMIEDVGMPFWAKQAAVAILTQPPEKALQDAAGFVFFLRVRRRLLEFRVGLNGRPAPSGLVEYQLDIFRR